jgi:hypothetical protein
MFLHRACLSTLLLTLLRIQARSGGTHHSSRLGRCSGCYFGSAKQQALAGVGPLAAVMYRDRVHHRFHGVRRIGPGLPVRVHLLEPAEGLRRPNRVPVLVAHWVSLSSPSDRVLALTITSRVWNLLILAINRHHFGRELRQYRQALTGSRNRSTGGRRGTTGDLESGRRPRPNGPRGVGNANFAITLAQRISENKDNTLTSASSISTSHSRQGSSQGS